MRQQNAFNAIDTVLILWQNKKDSYIKIMFLDIFKFYNIKLNLIHYNNMLSEYKFYVTYLFHNDSLSSKKITHQTNKHYFF